MKSDERSGVYQLQCEVERIVNRYADESELTAAELIGVLEIVKQSWVHKLFHKEEC